MPSSLLSLSICLKPIQSFVYVFFFLKKKKNESTKIHSSKLTEEFLIAIIFQPIELKSEHTSQIRGEEIPFNYKNLIANLQ